MKLAFTILAALAFSACTPLYTPPATWTSGDSKMQGDFRPDLYECVQYFDRPHLYEMNDDGEYQASGFFVDTSRTQSVVSCMEARGWNTDGPGWYSGPVR